VGGHEPEQCAAHLLHWIGATVQRHDCASSEKLCIPTKSAGDSGLMSATHSD
jgi:hypothetical protein